MRTVIVFNHPYEGSYCNAILDAAITGLERANHEVDLIHLDKDGFNPVMTSEDLKAFIRHAPVDPMVLNYKERIEKGKDGSNALRIVLQEKNLFNQL